MSWFFSKPNTNYPEPTALQTQRRKQIEQLKSLGKYVTEVQADTEYSVSTFVSGSTVSFLVTLPAQFPQDKPIVKVTPALRHSWVNESMQVTGCPGINNFVVNSDLAKVIRSLEEEFQKNPPVLLSHLGTSSGSPFGPTSTRQGSASYSPMPSQFTADTSPITYPKMSSRFTTAEGLFQASAKDGSGHLPLEISSAFSQLDSKSADELQELCQDEDKFLALFEGLPVVTRIAQERKELCEAMERLALANLDKKPLLEDKKRILLEKFDQLNELQDQFDQDMAQQERLLAQFEPGHLQICLQVACAQAEDESRQIVESFLSREIEVDNFLKKYMKVRSTYHLRRIKEDKLQQLILSNRGNPFS